MVTVKSCNKTGDVSEYKGTKYVEFEFELSDGTKGFTGVNEKYVNSLYPGVIVDSAEKKFDRKDGKGAQYFLKTSEPASGSSPTEKTTYQSGASQDEVNKRTALIATVTLATENKLDVDVDKFADAYKKLLGLLS